MTVLWQINLQHHHAADDNIDLRAQQIIDEFNAAHFCKPRIIYLASNSIGQVVGEKLMQAGLPVQILSGSEWRQAVDPLVDGPTEYHLGETCL